MSTVRSRSTRPEDPQLPRVRVELYAGLSPGNSALAFVRAYNAAAADWVTLADTLEVWDANGGTHAAGSLVYATLWPDSRRWEVDCCGGGKARHVHFTLYEALTTAMESAVAFVDHYYDGTDPNPDDVEFRVYNSQMAWAAGSGKQGGSSYDPELDRYWIDWLECA
jgi:hypothetical protein